MDEIEVPLEKVTEDMHHAVHHHEGGAMNSMMNRAAIMSALLAVLAAVSALFAGHYANDAMIEQIQASDHWTYYQAKGIKLAITEMRHENAADDHFTEKIEQYKADQEKIKDQAEEKQHEAEEHLRVHQGLAAAVTFFQVAIALTAIAVLARKRRFLGAALGIGLFGVVWMVKSFLF